jgi:uncharacterized protein with GYD domain
VNNTKGPRNGLLHATLAAHRQHRQDTHRQAAGLHAAGEGFGGKLHSYVFCLGEYDGLGICEFPDYVSVVACSMHASSTGAFSRFETTVLLTAKEAEAAMKQAHDAKINYKPPNA